MTAIIHSAAPDFSLMGQDGVTHKLVDYKGKWLLLYFYPKDGTSGCTLEACSLRDTIPDFSGLHAEVMGISSDSAESHKLFAEEHSLPFSLLSDPEKNVMKAYGVFDDQSFNQTKRTSFLINPSGSIEKVYEGVNPEVHAGEVISDLKKLV